MGRQRSEVLRGQTQGQTRVEWRLAPHCGNWADGLATQSINFLKSEMGKVMSASCTSHADSRTRCQPLCQVFCLWSQNKCPSSLSYLEKNNFSPSGIHTMPFFISPPVCFSSLESIHTYLCVSILSLIVHCDCPTCFALFISLLSKNFKSIISEI